MVSPDLQRIANILEYCSRIAKTVKRYGHDYNTFISDGDYFDSVSMKIMQIGELAGGLSEEFREKTKNRMQWGAIRGMRNLFAHAYASMNKKIIWDVAVYDIPGLFQFCVDTLETEGINLQLDSFETVYNLADSEKPSVIAAIRAAETEYVGAD